MTAMAANLNRPGAKSTRTHGLREATHGAFREATRQLASGVFLVTWGSGQDHAGLTATSVGSLSADPPTLLVSVNRTSSGYPVLQSHGEFVVNALAADQREIADRFVGAPRLTREDPICGGRWLGLPGGASYLAGSVAVFDCEALERIERRAHSIFIGHVRRVLVGDGSGALVRWRGAYDQVGWSRDEIARAVGLSPCGARTD